VFISALSVTNFRSFVSSGRVELGRVNVFVGPNNAGKSSLLKAIYLLQAGSATTPADIRLDATSSAIEMDLVDLHGIDSWGPAGDGGQASLRVELSTNGERTSLNQSMVLTRPDGGTTGVGQLPNVEPHHVVVPYFSRRKAVGYQEDVREQFALQVTPALDYLAAKLSRLGNFAFPAGQQYRETCAAILGFVVTAVPSPNGQRPGAYLQDRRTIPLDQMGDGVPNIVGLLADLALSERKILLIEEPENDLHPEALKALLELVEKSANQNQVVVSTHSNIVVRHLGALPDSRLFYVDVPERGLPATAEVRAVEASVQSRISVLRELGYRFSDFDLWDGWLILEESSAERIIRDYLIPWFVPRLTRVRTVAAGGNSQVEPTFDDFHRLVRFTHLEEAYTDAAWVRVDGDDEGRAIVARLRDRYPSWTADRFGLFTEAEFERYYPATFRADVERVLAIPDRQSRREAKRELLTEVRQWLDEDRERAQDALAESAAPVIADLQQIAGELDARSD
jgi:predicted ATPase